MSLALARKYRPRKFADVAVQSHVSETLRGAIGRGRVAHGYLLCGPRGVGKTTLARVLAMALNCGQRTAEEGEPCGMCESCQRIWSGAASLDVVEIDAASNRGVDDARDLRARAMYAPSGEERYKVYIVDEAHMLTREAWNALLKILEEPPPRVVFVFATTEPQKIAQTAAPVLSRLQRFDFKRIGPADIRARLETVLAAERIPAEPDALAMLARAADGSLRDALSLADQALSLGDGALTTERVRLALGLIAEDEYLSLLDVIAERRAADVFTVVGRFADAGVDFGSLLVGLADMIRAQLAIELGSEAPDVSERARSGLARRRGRLQAADLLRMLGAIGELEPRFRKSAQQQLLIETLLVRFALLDRAVALEDLLKRLDVGPASGRGSAGSPTRPEESPAPPSSRERRSAGADASLELADRTPPAAPARDTVALDINRLSERWDEVVDRLRASGRSALAGVMQHILPIAVTSSGIVTVQLDEPNEFFREAFEAGEREVRAAIAHFFPGVERLTMRPADAPVPAAKRMTEASIRSERLAKLRTRDPVLDAAIDALDLELMD